MSNTQTVNILLVDDEIPALEVLKDTVMSVNPNAIIYTADNYLDALNIASEQIISIAVLDIEMPGKTGVELGKLLKDINPRINIIFLTAYDSYAYDASQLFNSGYLLKPVNKTKLREQFDNLRYPIVEAIKKLTVQCFGNFDVYHNGEPVQFERSKSRELLAYLVDRRGARVTMSELAAVLYEEEDEDRAKKNIYSAWHSLKKSLQKINFEEVLIHSQNNYGVNTDHLECDYYRYLDGEDSAKLEYRGQYMYQYSWAEFSFGRLQ